MRQQHLILGTAIIAASAMFGAMGAEGADAPYELPDICSDASTSSLPSCTCKSPTGYQIRLQSETATPGAQVPPGTTPGTTYRYLVGGPGGSAKVNTISQVQIVVPRPLASGNQAPAGQAGIFQALDVFNIRDYCTPDPNSGINKGNCQGFLVHAVVHGATNTSGLIDIPVGTNVADGTVTFNIIGGNGNSEQCSAIRQDTVSGVISVPTPLSGIVGPGDIGDPFQPKFAWQDAKVAGGKCVATLEFDKKGNVKRVTAVNAPDFENDPTVSCRVGSPGDKDGDGKPTSNFLTKDIVIGGQPLKNNNGPHGITFGDGTTTCYGPSIPSPAKCVCTKSPCP